MRRPSVTYSLYALTIFISSFLLFQVQPLIGKHILPWFGGSSAVWVTALFFFMIALAVGYVYALALTWLTRTGQVIAHVSVLAVTGAVLLQHGQSWPSAITPAATDMVLAGADPAWLVVLVLTVSIGLPFVVLSSTSSLLQYWYGQATQDEPFSLYAVSNAGSLLGLLSYPVLFERFLPTFTQGYWWTWGVAVSMGMVVVVMWHVLTHQPAPVQSVATTKATRPTAQRFGWWLLIASIPIATMVTATDFVTGYVVAVPFLWVIPLALYLTSFIVSFSGGLRLPEQLTYIITLLCTASAIMVLNTPGIAVPVTLVTVFIAMFSVFHVCHETLYAHRPAAEYLTTFYVALSFGGIFASAVVLVVSLYMLSLPLEFLLILVAVGSYCGYLLLRYEDSFLQSIHRFAHLGVMVVISLVIAVSFAQVTAATKNIIATERNFFGYKAVSEVETATNGTRRTLIHGVTNHGYQLSAPEFESVPVSYYSQTAGVSMGFDYLRERQPEGLRVAVAGLGAGALAAHCREGDRFTFFEIDQQVIDIAYQYFTYLDRCNGHEVFLGDARLELQTLADSANPPQYDYIILDAYADDVMPIHIMTTEAISLYQSLLAPGGVLAVHISSRYLNLLPVMTALAEDNKQFARQLFDREFADYATQSHWTLLAKEDIFTADAFARMEPLEAQRTILWTDIYSSLVPIIRW